MATLATQLEVECEMVVLRNPSGSCDGLQISVFNRFWIQRTITINESMSDTNFETV